MAGAAPTKKTSKEAPVKRGIWLSERGQLSFGCGTAGETLITEPEYAALKPQSAAARMAFYTSKSAPPEAKEEKPTAP
jgi:hypothetical protein